MRKAGLVCIVKLLSQLEALTFGQDEVDLAPKDHLGRVRWDLDEVHASRGGWEAIRVVPDVDALHREWRVEVLEAEKGGAAARRREHQQLRALRRRELRDHFPKPSDDGVPRKVASDESRVLLQVVDVKRLVGAAD